MPCEDVRRKGEGDNKIEGINKIGLNFFIIPNYKLLQREKEPLAAFSPPDISGLISKNSQFFDFRSLNKIQPNFILFFIFIFFSIIFYLS